MSSLANMNRASYNRPHVHIGKRPTQTRAASDKERNQIRNIVTLLNEALDANTVPTLSYKLSSAYRGLYYILKARNS